MTIATTVSTSAVTFDQWLKFKPPSHKLELFARACAEQVNARYDGVDTPELLRAFKYWLSFETACPQAELIACIGGPWGKCVKWQGSGRIIDNSMWEAVFDICRTCHGSGCVPMNATLCGSEHHSCRHCKGSGVRKYGPASGNPYCSYCEGTAKEPCEPCQRILAWGGTQQPCERCGETGVGDLACGQMLCPACSGRGYTTIGTVQQLAQTIYDNRDFGLMPMLADALEDAGCENQTVLAHCRKQRCPCSFQHPPHDYCDGVGTPVVHARGCWAVDLFLGMV